MTDTPLDLDAIEARALAATDGPWTAHEFGSYSDHEPTSIVVMQGDGPDWWQSADDGDYIARLGWDRQEWDDAEFIAHARTDMPALVAALRKANAQVAAVLALCDEAAPRRMGDGYLSASVLAPEDVRAAVEGAGDVPMSPDMGHDLRERIAQRIDQAWAEANDRRPRSEYRDGYLDGLEHAEAAARSTPLTMGGAS